MRVTAIRALRGAAPLGRSKLMRPKRHGTTPSPPGRQFAARATRPWNAPSSSVGGSRRPGGTVTGARPTSARPDPEVSTPVTTWKAGP